MSDEHELPANGETAAPITHPEEIRLESEFRLPGKATMRSAIRITPAGLVCTGLAVAAILLSTAVLVRAVRRTGSV